MRLVNFGLVSLAVASAMHLDWHAARPVAVSLGILGVASVAAAVVEPAWEYWVDGASYEWAFGSSRLGAFAMFVAAGTVAHVIVMIVSARRMLR